MLREYAMINEKMQTSAGRFDIEPIAKQSTSFGNGRAYTPKRFKDWAKKFRWTVRQDREFFNMRYYDWASVELVHAFPFKKAWPSVDVMMKWTAERQAKEGIYIDQESGTIYRTLSPDLTDNLNKLVIDCLQEMGIFDNDGIICQFKAEKIHQPEPYIQIKITGQ